MEKYLGLTCVTASALIFGLVAAMVKLVGLPPLVMLQLRSFVQWAASLLVIACRARSSPDSLGSDTTGKQLFGGTELHEANTRCCGRIRLMERSWLALRAVLYWGFVVCWWSALTYTPVGDATAIVYCGPIFTSLFAYLLLREKISLAFWVCMPMAIAGMLLITQPGFLFASPAYSRLSSPSSSPPSFSSSSGVPVNEEKEGDSYARGVVFALSGAVVSGLLPVCVRASKLCHWTTVEHATSALSGFVFTPLALAFQYLAPTAVNTFQYPELSPGRIMLLLVAAMVGFAGLGLQTYGYQHEEASKASVMTFLEIPFAYLLQHFVFQQTVNGWGLAGVSLVMCSGLTNVAFRAFHNSNEAKQALASNLPPGSSEYGSIPTGVSVSSPQV